MTTVSIDDPQFQSAIHACAAALKRMAEYEIDPSLSHRMHELGARKEYLNQVEHNELLALALWIPACAGMTQGCKNWSGRVFTK